MYALKTLNLPTEHWDEIVIHLVSQKLDKTSFTEWEEFKCNKTLPSLNEFYEFLKSRADFLETLDCSVRKFDHLNENIFKHNYNKGKGEEKKSLLSFLIESKSMCNFCKGNHLICSRKKFLDLSISDN